MTNRVKLKSNFGRDASKRLTYEIYPFDSEDYVQTCQQLIKAFSLEPIGEVIVGLDEIFQDYHYGDTVVGLEWDIWSGFTVVAKAQESEELVKKIGSYLDLLLEQLRTRDAVDMI
jgi:hypothetical protein